MESLDRSMINPEEFNNFLPEPERKLVDDIVFGVLLVLTVVFVVYKTTNLDVTHRELL